MPFKNRPQPTQRPRGRVNPDKYRSAPRRLTKRQQLDEYLKTLKFRETPESTDINKYKTEDAKRKAVRPIHDHNNDNTPESWD